jgi:hypothetical protein
MIRVRRRDRLWLVLVSILASLAIFASSVALSVKIGVGLLFGLMVLLAVVDTESLTRLRRRVVTEKPTGTAQAREALQRASAVGGGDWVGLTLEDIGLIASLQSEDGLTFERTRTLDNDYDGVRPYVQLQVGVGMAERRARVRYELLDPSGEVRFVHEDNTFLRAGANTLHPDQHMPLAGAVPAGQMGQWDARVYIDGRLVGVIGFSVSPTTDERLGRLGGARRAGPSSFEDLLRQGRNDRGG